MRACCRATISWGFCPSPLHKIRCTSTHAHKTYRRQQHGRKLVLLHRGRSRVCVCVCVISLLVARGAFDLAALVFSQVSSDISQARALLGTLLNVSVLPLAVCDGYLEACPALWRRKWKQRRKRSARCPSCARARYLSRLKSSAYFQFSGVQQPSSFNLLSVSPLSLLSLLLPSFLTG